MAYNREWDKGKDTWSEGSAWPGAGSGGNVRSRDEDYYGDGKRRKFNNGAFQGYDTSYAYDDSSHAGYGQHRQNDQEHANDDRSRGGAGGFVKKRLAPSEPSPHVIFLGLDPDFTEADLQAYLSANGCSVETVTIIRERSSGSSKGFGFAQFTSTEHARAFVDPLFPFIQVPPPASHGASATASFYKALETGIPHNGRRVKIDYSQSATPHDKGRFNRGNLNDGTRDIGNSQSPVLLFRGLDPLSGPQAIYQAMLYSSGPGKQGAQGMRRIILIKDRVTMASFGFAFVEFVDIHSASAVLAATMSPQIHPSGFRISDRPVAASFAHPYSFQPVTDFLARDDACLASSNSLGGAEGAWVRYWDETSTVAVLEFKVEEAPKPASAVNEKHEKKRTKGVVDTSSTDKAPAAPSTLPVSDKPVTLSFNKGPTKLNSGPTKPLVPGFSMDDTNGGILGEGGEDDTGSEPSKPITVKKVAPLIASKKTVNNINKWNQVQEELAHETVAPPTAPALITPAKSISVTVSNTPVAAPKASAEIPPLSAESEFEFADISSLMCLLCARQFKSMEQLKRHNKESDLHKKNFQDSNLREVARQKVLARKVSEQPKYRDRASERRTLFNQPETPAPDKDVAKNKKRQVENVSTPPAPTPSTNPGQDDSNVGNKLLKMMGWKEGTGLGTEEDGRIDPVQTAVYAQGVGLGASKGKDIAKYAEGYSGYVHMAQDAARERFGS